MVNLALESPPSLAGNLALDLRRLALVVEYQGTRYHGFQLQSGPATIQGELEHALHQLTGQEVRVRGASRTDSGAHARAQVVDFATTTPLSCDTILRGLNFYLPPDVKVRGTYEVDLEFHSRTWAQSRTYRYTFVNSATPSPLMREFAHWVQDPLDVASMNQAALALCGAHDFAPLAGPVPPERGTVRNVTRWELWRDGEQVFMEAQGSGFLPHQVRKTGSVLLEVGLGRLDTQVLHRVLAGEMEVPAWCAYLPAKGLCLMAVKYRNSLTESTVI